MPQADPVASIVIPIYNCLQSSSDCVDSIYQSAGDLSFEVLAVDNGSGPEVAGWMARQGELRAEFHCLRHPQPLGFARAVNMGAAHARGRTLVVLNSDTIVTRGWLEGLHEALRSDPTLAVVSPMTNRAGESAMVDPAAIDLPAGKAFEFAARRAVSAEVLILPQRLVFFCAAFRREVWRELDGLSEVFDGGNFEDDDFCLRARMAGYRLGVARHIFVYHQGGATYEANRIDHARTMKKNAVVFAERASAAALAADPEPHRFPKSELRDVSVVIEAFPGGDLADTLRSLVNQTVTDFEVIPPQGEKLAESRCREAFRVNRHVNGSFVAYVRQGDILYPFHIETLRDVMRRTQAQAVYANWALRNETLLPDRWSPRPPRGAWMHQSGLDPDRLFDLTRPVHWPRMTWESRSAPEKKSAGEILNVRYIKELARGLYWRVVPYRTRLKIDCVVRRNLRLPGSGARQARHIERALTGQREHGRFAAPGEAPEIFLFSIVPWDSLVQRPHHFACGLTARGHRVFWVDTTLSARSRWWSGQPLEEVAGGVRLLQLPGSAADTYNLSWTGEIVKAMRAALLQTAAAYGCECPVCLVNDPRWEPVVSGLPWPLVYDCLDSQAAFAEMWRIDPGDREQRLFDQARLVLFSARALREMHGRPGSILLPNAADFDLFSSTRSRGFLAHLPRPICGFFGTFSGWLDLHLIEEAARRFSSWSFVYIGSESFPGREGRKHWRRIAQLPNVTVFPRMDPATLAAHLADFDLCTIPFLDLPISRTMNPVKIYEYLAAGKPVISRDLIEMRPLAQQGLISVYTTETEFFGCLEHAVRRPGTPEEVGRRRAFAAENTWNRRVDALDAELRRLVSGSAGLRADPAL